MRDEEVFQGEMVDNPRGPVSKKERGDRLREYALFAPRLVKLVYRLLKDERVPTRSKTLLVFVAGYLVSPIDLIPDMIPGVGQFDDLLVAALALDQILNRVPDHVVIEHWEGDEDVLRIIREILDLSTGFVPERIRKRFIKQ